MVLMPILNLEQIILSFSFYYYDVRFLSDGYIYVCLSIEYSLFFCIVFMAMILKVETFNFVGKKCVCAN